MVAVSPNGKSATCYHKNRSAESRQAEQETVEMPHRKRHRLEQQRKRQDVVQGFSRHNQCHQ